MADKKEPKKFTVDKNKQYLSTSVSGYYTTDYVGMGNPGNPNYLNDLKNQLNDFSKEKLDDAQNALRTVLQDAIPEIIEQMGQREVTVCVVPRAKKNHGPKQLLFKSTVKDVIASIPNAIDGTDYIARTKNTQITHLAKSNFENNDDPAPYPGITEQTCSISENVRGKNILLIDDIYTKSVNVDEDAIQALLKNGANSVTFYAVAKTIRH